MIFVVKEFRKNDLRWNWKQFVFVCAWIKASCLIFRLRPERAERAEPVRLHDVCLLFVNVSGTVDLAKALLSKVAVKLMPVTCHWAAPLGLTATVKKGSVVLGGGGGLGLGPAETWMEADQCSRSFCFWELSFSTDFWWQENKVICCYSAVGVSLRTCRNVGAALCSSCVVCGFRGDG